MDLVFSALCRYYTAWQTRCLSHSVVTLSRFIVSAPVRHVVLFWHLVFVRNLAFAVFSVWHFSSAIFSVRSRLEVSGRLPLHMHTLMVYIAYAMGTRPETPVTIWYYHSCLQRSRPQLVLRSQHGHQYSKEYKLSWTNCNEFQPFPRMIHTSVGTYSRPGQQHKITRCCHPSIP